MSDRFRAIAWATMTSALRTAATHPPVSTTGFMLKPLGFFDHIPGLGAPPPTHGCAT